MYRLHISQYFTKQETIHLALAVPLSGKHMAVGLSFKKGVDLYIEEINARGGVHGRRLELDLYDDLGQADRAAQVAEQIAADRQAVAVIGHSFSSCSIAGGKVYQKEHIPAITGQATNIHVTRNNDWYFRSLFNDSFQGRFLPNYISKLSNENNISIIHEDLAYGRELAEIVSTSARQSGLSMRYSLGFKVTDPNLDQRLEKIATDLYSKVDAGIIIIACHTSEGSRLIKALKDQGITNKLVVPHTFDSQKFITGFKKYSKEKLIPGYYTNGIYVLSPLIFATANSKAQQFKRRFMARYQEEPEWRAAYGYDTAMILTKALMECNISGRAATLVDDRQNILNFLKNLHSSEDALEGVTGLNYFDENGDAVKPVSVGIFKGQRVSPAPIQLQAMRTVQDMPDLFDAQLKGDIISIEKQFLHRTNVIFTGIKLKRISAIDLSQGTCRLDFNIWMRYQGNLDTTAIEFINAQETLHLGTPLLIEKQGNLTYKLFRVQGEFRLDFLPGFSPPGQHLVGISLRHRDLPRYNLVFVSDDLGMGLGSRSGATRQLWHTITTPPGWQLGDMFTFQNVVPSITQGNLQANRTNLSHFDSSTYNVCINIEQDNLALRRFLGADQVRPLLIISTTVLLLLLLFSGSPPARSFPLLYFCTSLAAGTTFLLTLEPVLLQRLLKEGIIGEGSFIQLFTALWWLLGAALSLLACNTFIWYPIEKLAQRNIPKLLHLFTFLFIFGGGLLAVLVFVLHENRFALAASLLLTLLLVTLSRQLHPANLLATLTILQEKLYSPGDRVQFDDHPPGEVMEINWQSTRLRQSDQTIFIIPNQQAITAFLTLHPSPTKETDV
jgi:branched-chain amino acid transport system substrate-binding protein